MYICMNCENQFGAPAFVQELAGSNRPVLPVSQRRCKKCGSNQVKTQDELNQEMADVINDAEKRFDVTAIPRLLDKHLTKYYPNFTFRPHLNKA